MPRQGGERQAPGDRAAGEPGLFRRVRQILKQSFLKAFVNGVLFQLRFIQESEESSYQE